MNPKLKAAFTQMKPVCDKLMINPTPENIKDYLELINDLKREYLQDLQQYLLFPIISHLQSKEMEGRHEVHRFLLIAMKVILDKINVVSFELCIKIEMTLAVLAFDKNKPGMIAEIPEEMKLTAIQCMTSLMLNIETPLRLRLIKSHAPLLAQAIFVSVHMAKLEKFRILRLAALESLLAHTSMHSKLTDATCMITDPVLEEAVVQMLCCILPGVLATLQDVAMCPNNPGHAVIVMALNATHRIMCMTMNDKHLKARSTVSVADIIKVIKEKENANYVSKAKTSQLTKLSKEWFEMAGEKLEAVMRSLVRLGAHEHYKVRKELSVLCYRVLSECNSTMQPSISMCLDILISLSSDSYTQVANYCSHARAQYFRNASPNSMLNVMDSLTRNLFMVLGSLPRILNNIDSARKLASLNLLEGYIELLSEGSPQRLTSILSSNEGYSKLCDSLASASAIQTDLALLNRHAARDVTATPPIDSPWCKFRHLDSKECITKFQRICLLLGETECGQLILDTLLDTFRERRDCELLFLMNLMASAPKSTDSLAKRVIDAYIEEDIWYLPLEVASEAPITDEETLDISVYNPRAWDKDNVPGLFEGATETRYTDISYLTPRTQMVPTGCRTLRQAQHNMVQCCLLTEGLGLMARRLGKDFQPYLLKTLCLVLERVGSRYEMLHLSGVKAINEIKSACGNTTVGELIAHNADYFTHQITRRLKKAWNTQSALEILSVVMEYSDSTILEYMYGIVEDVLLQSCDKYYQKNLYSYLQVFHTFVSCIYKWFPHKRTEDEHTDTKDVLDDVIEYIKSEEEAQRAINESEKDGRSVEEMFNEDLERTENDALDYDDTVTKEKPPLPKHIEVTITILKRCINFVPAKNRDDAILTLQILTLGLPVIKDYEDELLPLVHQTWGPLVTRFEDADTAVLRRALDVLVTLAMLSKDFIRHRTLKEVLPKLYKQLHTLSIESHLKDTGSSYRLSPPFHLQIAALTALAPLATELRLSEDDLEEAMKCVSIYLSRKQPKPLQALAIQFFKTILSYNFGAAWLYLRGFCNNSNIIEPPNNKFIKLAEIIGTPYECDNKDYDKNVKAIIFD
ncbi:TELO2-interacting protein 1 homolog isoform X2 [Pieris napi]|uniref:TELO2-interacting protein 1 homolog isoform X2 n=1 Tax=Pieris napi TaxID=78633 RepID=UPI001FBA433F|nr:TELO2-interacting protein 1 homolog isoform X2 [Pieris napi]